MKSEDVKRELRRLADPRKAEGAQRYFKTYADGYGAGDKFLGLMVPVQRVIARKFVDLPLAEVKKLLESPIHEHRFVALEILVFKYEYTTIYRSKKKIVDFYLKNRKWVNNWDLVDTSAPYILGHWLLGRDKAILYKLARSKNIWDRRIAIVATYEFIRHGNLTDTFKISKMLLGDTHDLIHKATGWMLREVGKKSEPALENFLKKHHKVMPRTMLRYSLEKFSPAKRRKYMRK